MKSGFWGARRNSEIKKDREGLEIWLSELKHGLLRLELDPGTQAVARKLTLGNCPLMSTLTQWHKAFTCIHIQSRPNVIKMEEERV